MASTDPMQFQSSHPGVYSRIQSVADSYTVTGGALTLFAADAFDKGPDNTINLVGSVEQFIDKYGEPNFDKYGQQAYNIEQWLNAGGQAYVMRLLPDDATFAHSILNIQTRIEKNSKKVRNADGNIINMDNVYLRPTAAYLKRNNTRLDTLENELNVDRDSYDQTTTIDGYLNHFIMMVIPEGRGEYYNNLAYRITPNSAYTSSDKAQVYNFETIQIDEDNNMNILEGPFYATFSSESLDNNGQTMFIEDVVNRYSSVFTVKFNEKQFREVAGLINPNVNPFEVNILTGETMDDPNSLGAPVTYYDEKLKQNMDIHFTLFSYDSDGNPVVSTNGDQVLNISSPNDTVESGIIELDNKIREANYNRDSSVAKYMTHYYPFLVDDVNSSSNFASFRSQLSSQWAPDVDDDTDLPKAGTGKFADYMDKFFNADNEDSLYSKFKLAKGHYAKVLDGTASDDEKKNAKIYRNMVLSYSDQMSKSVNSEAVVIMSAIRSMYLLVESDLDQTNADVNYRIALLSLVDEINRGNQISSLADAKLEDLANLINDVSTQISGYSQGNKIANAISTLQELDDEVITVRDNLASAVYGATNVWTGAQAKLKQQFESLSSRLDADLRTMHDIRDGYISLSTAPASGSNVADGVYLPDLLNRQITMANELITIVNNVLYDSQVKLIENSDTGLFPTFNYAGATASNTSVVTAVSKFIDSISTSLTVNDTNTAKDIQGRAKVNVDKERDNLANYGSSYYNNSLLNFQGAIGLESGTDGSFEYNSASQSVRRTNIAQMQIQAFKGLVDEDISNKNLFPFDLILDARYRVEVKNAIADFVRNTREDSQFFADTADSDFSATPQAAIDWRTRRFPIMSEYVSIFTQDFEFYDSYLGRNTRMSPSYALASKIPANNRQYGLQYPLAGPRRGVIDGFTNVSWFPNEIYKEQLYKKSINYFEYESDVTKLGSQSTTKRGRNALSQINNMFTLLRLKRGAEEIVSEFIFEMNTSETKTALYNALSSYAQQFISDHSINNFNIEISASDYDIQQRILRVNINIKFNGVIERVGLTLGTEN